MALKTRHTPSPLWKIIIATPFIVGVLGNVYDFYVYRQLGILYVTAFFVAILLLLSLFNPYPIVRTRHVNSINWVYLGGVSWFVTAFILGFYYPQHQITGISGGYFYYLSIILLSVTAIFIGNQVPTVLTYRTVARIIALIPILLLLSLIWHLNRIGLSLSHAITMTHIPNGKLLDWNSISVVAALCLSTVGSLYFESKSTDKLFSTLSLFSIIVIIILSASRTSFTVMLIILVFLLYKTKANKRILLTLLAMPLLFFIMFVVSNSFPSLLNKLTMKTDDYWYNLYYVRYELITVKSLSEWGSNVELFLRGDGYSWGHNHIVTVALKSGMIVLLIYLLFLFLILQAAWKSQKIFRNEAVLLFVLVFSANLVGDFIFTVPYYAFLSMFLIGWLSRSRGLDNEEVFTTQPSLPHPLQQPKQFNRNSIHT